MPKVSIVIPVYNCEKYIVTAIESVLNQTYKDYEIIVVDDGSTDNTAKVLEKFAGKIIYIYQPNRGPGEARNTGALNAKGEYLAFLDQDDAWLPDKLKLQVEILEKSPEIGLVYSDEYILDNENFMKPDFQGKRVFQLRRPHRGKIFKELFLDNFIPTSSVMIRKVCLNKIGMFNPTLTPAEDYDRWLRLTVDYGVDYLDKALVKYRDHVACFRKDEIATLNNIIKTINGIMTEYSNLIDIFRKKANQRLAHFHIALGKAYLAKGSFKNAFYNFYQGIRLTKSAPILFYIIFSAIFDGLFRILRYIKAKIFIQK